MFGNDKTLNVEGREEIGRNNRSMCFMCARIHLRTLHEVEYEQIDRDFYHIPTLVRT